MAFRFLPVLDNLRVATPCDQEWNEMNAVSGTDRVKHCGSCKKNVFNLSAMTRDAALDLVRQAEGDLCVRFFRRHDGSILTADCPTGLRKSRRNKIVLATAATVLAVGAYGAFRMMPGRDRDRGEVLMGGIEQPIDRPTPVDVAPTPVTGQWALGGSGSDPGPAVEPAVVKRPIVPAHTAPPAPHVVAPVETHVEVKGGVGFHRGSNGLE